MLIYMLESAYVGTVSRVFVSKMSGTRFSLYQSIVKKGQHPISVVKREFENSHNR